MNDKENRLSEIFYNDFKEEYLQNRNRDSFLPANSTILKDYSIIEIDSLVKKGILQKRNCEGLAYELTNKQKNIILDKLEEEKKVKSKSISINFKNILSEIKDKDIKIIIGIGNTICIEDNKSNLYEIETYYHGSYLEKFIKNESIVTFNQLEKKQSEHLKDLYKNEIEVFDYDKMKDFYENVVLVDYPELKNVNGLDKNGLTQFMYSEFPTAYNNVHSRELLENSIDFILKTTSPSKNSLFYNLKKVIPEITDEELIKYIDPSILTEEITSLIDNEEEEDCL